MTTNLTIDDSSPDIIYSSNWTSQSTGFDPSTDRFFQSTYHSAQANGATANLTFTGSAIYLYGSRGPGHANFSVQFDNFIMFLSAEDSVTRYQHLLFGFAFNASGTHFLSLTSIQVDDKRWLDLDYITITVNETDSAAAIPSTSTSSSTTSTSPASATISPPWLLESSTSGFDSTPTSSTSTAEPLTDSTSSSSRVTLILAAVFGAIILALLVLGLGFLFARAKRRRDDRRLGLRVGTPGAGTGFAYKEPPSPSFFCGPMSPASAEVYSEHSPSSRADPFHRDGTSGIENDAPVNMPDRPGQASVHGVDGRHSPFSVLSMGGATVLTAGSTAQLLNPHLQKGTAQEAAPLMHKQSLSSSIDGAGVGVGSRLVRSRSPLAHLGRAGEASGSKPHRAIASESAIKAGIASGSGLATGEKVGKRAEGSLGLALDTEASELPFASSIDSRPPPLHAQHAPHRSDSDISSGLSDPAPPRRPKRPGDGLLDFIGSQLAQKLERTASSKRRREDANSERTNFLKV